jgi:hypothetical protein
MKNENEFKVYTKKKVNFFSLKQTNKTGQHLHLASLVFVAVLMLAIRIKYTGKGGN